MISSEDINCTLDTIPWGIWERSMPPMEVKTHPSSHKKIVVINYPGVLGDIDGYSYKYAKVAHLVAQKIGTALRISGPEGLDDGEYRPGVVEKLKAVIEYAIWNSHTLADCNQDELEIYLMGFSAGASGVAAVCWNYPEVKKILLIAPGGDAGEEASRTSLAKFSWNVYAIVGQDDEIVGTKTLQRHLDASLVATRKRWLIIPNCDHQFRWTKNGQLMSASPIWAFLKNGEWELETHDGIILY